MKFKNKKSKIIFKSLLALAYFACCLVLIIEASLPGKISADHSNSIGGGIADIINNGAGDQSVLINPTGLKIKTPSSDTLYVSNTYQLETTIKPENCSYKSVSFSSDDESVLSVDENGLVKANKEGKATVTAWSTSFTEIKDSFTFNVINIKETAIKSRLSNVKTDDNGVYILEANRNYNIETTFTPNNTTDKSLHYSFEMDGIIESEISDYLTIDGSTIYTKKKTPEGKQIIITSHSKLDKTSSFKAKIIENPVEVIPLESISVKAKTNPQYYLAVNESVDFTSKFSIEFSPAKATYKQYKLESSDTSIIKISGNKIIGVKEGEAEIIVSSTTYDISTSIRVQVAKRELKDIRISLNYLSEARLKKGTTSYIKYSSPNPVNSDCILQRLYDYKSSDESILKVDNSGKVTAINKGTATVTMNFYQTRENMDKRIIGFSKSISITIFEPSIISNVTFTNTLDETDDNSHILYNGKDYNLSNYIKIDKMYDVSGKEINSVKVAVSTSLTYSITSKTSTVGDLSEVKINGTTLSTKGNLLPGVITIEYTHPVSMISDSVKYTILNEVKPTIQRDEDSRSLTAANKQGKVDFDGKGYDMLSDELLIYVTSGGTIFFDENQNYSFHTENISVNYATVTSTTDNSITFRGVDEGGFHLLITPMYDNKEITSASKLMNISVRHKVAKSFSIHLFKGDDEMNLSDKTDEEGNIALSTDVDSVLKLQTVYSPFSIPTNYRLSVTSTDKKIGEYKNDKFLFHKIGKVSFEIKEEVSGYKKILTFYVVNRIEIDEEAPITLKQEKVSYDKENNVYHIENGMPAKIITNFKKSSTYKTVTYKSSNTEILKVGNDGNITPLKAGNADITCKVNDNNTINFSLKIHIVVDKKSLINNMSSFLYKIRKGLGHFGAFLITAVFSSLFYLFFFDDKTNWFFSVPFIFLQGFFLAELTEFIQLFTPGRSGLFSDVLIDFTGFSIGAGITLLIVLIYYIVIYLLKKYGKKKDTDETK